MKNISISARISVILLVGTLFLGVLCILPTYALLVAQNSSVQNASIQDTSVQNNSIQDTSVVSSVVSNNVVSNVDLASIISLDKTYYNKNDIVSIIIHNNTDVSNIGELSLEISVSDDPTYSYRYLGLLNSEISFIPENTGKYIVKLYAVQNNYALIAEKSFYVYSLDVNQCKNYNTNDYVSINLGSYAYYKNRSLPSSLNLVYQDSNNNSEVYVYTSNMAIPVTYTFSKPGTYSLFSEGNYLDCFIINSDMDITVNYDSYINNTYSSIFSGTAEGQNVSQNISQDIPVAYDRHTAYNNFYSTNDSKHFNLSTDKILDMRGMSNGLVFAEIQRNITYDIVELWLIDTNTADGNIRIIAFNESAPSKNIRFGIKGNTVFWVSEFGDKIYAYDSDKNVTVYKNVPEYNPGNGEVGKISFNDTVIDNGWDVITDGSQIYFYNPERGETFSDDDMSTKEKFRQIMNLDKYLDVQELSSLSLEVDQEGQDGAQ